MNKKSLIAASAAIAALVVIALYVYLTDKPTLHGSVIDPPLSAAEVRLTDFNGQPFTLENERGNVTLVYFGFTNCPDECPLTMAQLKLAMGELGPDSDRATVVLVTTDPGRDTPPALKEFLGRFHGSFVGLTGAPDQLAQVWQDYGVTVMDGGETHSNYIYVIDTAGNLVETLLPDVPPADIAADVRLLLDAD